MLGEAVSRPRASAVGDEFVAGGYFTCPRCQGICICAKCKDRRGEKRTVLSHKQHNQQPAQSTKAADQQQQQQHQSKQQQQPSSSSSQRIRPSTALSRPPAHLGLVERPQTRRRSGIVTEAPRRLANTVWDVGDEDEDDQDQYDDEDEDESRLDDEEDDSSEVNYRSQRSRKRTYQHHQPRASIASRQVEAILLPHRRHSTSLSGRRTSSFVLDAGVQPSRRSNRQRRSTNWSRAGADEWANWSSTANAQDQDDPSGRSSRARQRQSLTSARWITGRDDEEQDDQSELGVTDESDLENEFDHDVYARVEDEQRARFGHRHSSRTLFDEYNDDMSRQEDRVEPVWSSNGLDAWGAPGTALDDFVELHATAHEPMIDFGDQLDDVVKQQLEVDALASQNSKKRSVVWTEGPERRKRRLASMEESTSSSSGAAASSASPPELSESTSSTGNSPSAAVVGSPPPYTASSLIEHTTTPPELLKTEDDALLNGLEIDANLVAATSSSSFGAGGGKSSSFIDLDQYTDAEIGRLVRRALTLGQDMFAAATTQLRSENPGVTSAGLNKTTRSTEGGKLEFRNPFRPTAKTDAHLAVPSVDGDDDGIDNDQQEQTMTTSVVDEDEMNVKPTVSEAQELDEPDMVDATWVLRDDVNYGEPWVDADVLIGVV
ncbi:hypothetical protein OIO90_001893 [Microbotryomycetes sp. JL221]|nr:hypothetical protein OIO90_001893 [Microbotryomycetes sp. JL221]